MHQHRFHPVRVLRGVGRRLARKADRLDLKGVNVAFVESVKERLPHEEAMRQAIGGLFDEIGPIEAALLRHYGLPPDGYLIDVGCGSGRLAKPLAVDFAGRYLGIDLVPDLVAHARRICRRPDWRFEVVDHIAIPEHDGVADMVCFFSVLTHLLHEQGYWYLQEARRVLKPGGRIVFSFLEYEEQGHWQVFQDTLAASKQQARIPLNIFHDRAAIALWAKALGLMVEDIRSGTDAITPAGALGQAICVLSKPG
jgi:SAM-dependent methyltransferase